MNRFARIAVALGSNLGDRQGFLERAASRIVEDLLRNPVFSSVYESKAWPDPAAPSFLNAVVVGETEWKPPAIVTFLKELERELGRKSAAPNAPREIDLDLLLYLLPSNSRETSQEWISEGVAVPHPRMKERAFVLAPLAELIPEWSEALLALPREDILATRRLNKLNILVPIPSHSARQIE